MSRYRHIRPAATGAWIMILLVGAGCQSTQDIERTFDYGRAYLPAAATSKRAELEYRGTVLADRSFVTEELSDGYRELDGSWLDAVAPIVNPGARWPVVVFLHGCSGYAHYTSSTAEFYLSLGAVVVAPNSMNRPGRVAMCGRGNMAYRASLRKQEARYAASRLAKLSWVDPRRMILAGQSEGGNSVASYSGDEFVAHIITGTNCRHNGGAVSAPRGVAVLAIKGAEDTTYPNGSCSVGRDYGGSRSIVVPDAGHMVLTSKRAQTAISEFLRECCGIGAGPIRRVE